MAPAETAPDGSAVAPGDAPAPSAPAAPEAGSTATPAPTSPKIGDPGVEAIRASEATGASVGAAEEVVNPLNVPRAADSGHEERERDEDGDAATPGGPKFIKGELLYVGTRELVSRFDHVGVATGPLILDSKLFLGVAPGGAYYGDLVSFAVHVPLQLLVFDPGAKEYGGLKVRAEDWDEAPDFAKLVRFFTIGRKEDPIYFSVNTLRPSTLGYGMLMDKYQANLDIDRSMTSVMFDGYNKYGGFQLLANYLTFTNQILGGLAFVKPLFFVPNDIAQSWSIGPEWLADFKAPRCIKNRASGGTCIAASGHEAGNDPFSGLNLDESFVRSDPDTGRFAVEEMTVQAVGASTELKLYKDERNVDVKLYGTWHKFTNEGGGSGLSAGMLWRLNAGETWISAFRLRGELRSFGDGFLPGYFDTMYEVSKYGYFRQAPSYQVTPTKAQAVFGDEDNGFVREELGGRTGFSAEGSWGLFKHKRKNKLIALGGGVSDSNGPNDTSAWAHVEFPGLGFVQVFGSYILNNAASLSDALGGKPLEAENAVVLSGVRLQLLPILFINVSYSRSYAVTRSPGSEYHLGDSSIVDTNGLPSPYFKQDALFENVSTFFVNIELGWEFDDDETPETMGANNEG